MILLAGKSFGQQNAGVDSGLGKATKQVSTSSMELINEANKISSKDATKSMELATKALKNSLNQKDKAGENYAYNTLGTLYYNIGNYAKSSEYFSQARDGFTIIKDEKGKSYAEKYLAQSLEKQKKYSEALAVNNAWTSNSAYRSKEEVVKGKYAKARLKSKIGNKEEAIGELNSLAKDSSINIEGKINIYNELGDLYVEKNDEDNAYKTYFQALDLDNSKPEFTNSTKYLEVVNKVSELNIKNGRARDNVAIQTQLLNQGLKRKDYDLVQTANYNIGATYMQVNETKTAIPYLITSVSLAQQTKNPKQEQKSVKELSRAYENLGQFDKALDIYKRYVKLVDSFRALQTGNEEASLALNEEFLKQEEKIKGLLSTQKQKEDSIRRQRNIVWTLAVGLLAFLFLTWALVRNIRQKQKANMVIKLQSLRTQMNPHFIFNSLNSVNSFIAKNDERSANKYLSDFSKLMRTVLKNSDQDFVGLASEIQTLGIYLELEHFRFGEKFDYVLEVSPEVETESFAVPPMLIQPYIENAIWHGLRYKEEKGVLAVKFFVENEKLFCTVYDNGIGRKKSSELKTAHQKTYQSTGIKNTKERIELLNKLHKTSLNITITDMEENGESTGTLVKISLPYLINEMSY